jgi:hypothetical protein
MPDLFDPAKWYWKVAGDAAQVYSSASGTYVPVSNPAYVAWLANDNLPIPIDSEASLGEVLAPYYPTVPRPVAATVLDGYQQGQANDIFMRKFSKLIFHMINRIQVLEGKQPFTVAQARAYVKGQM